MLDIAQHTLHTLHAPRMRVRRGRRLGAVRPSKAAEIWYLNRISDLVLQCKKIIVAELTKSHEVSKLLMDSPFGKELGKIKEGFARIKGEAPALALTVSRQALRWTDDRLSKEVAKSLKIDIRPVLSEHGKVMSRFKEMAHWNVRLIESVPERMLDNLEEKLVTAWSSGLRVNSIEEVVDSVVNDADVNCKRIARDQVAKLNAAFNQVRQEELGIQKYIWRCSKDERTRGNPDGKYPDAESNHWELDGLEFRWDEPGPARGTIDGEPCHPGADINCRCDAIPVIDLDGMEKLADEGDQE